GGRLEGQTPRDHRMALDLVLAARTTLGEVRFKGVRFLGVEDAERVQRRPLTVVVRFPAVVHRDSLASTPRFSRSRVMPSRMRVFTVPSGCPSDAAISVWLNPSK